MSVIARGAKAGEWFIDYFHDLIPKRRANPGADLLSELIAAEDDGERLSHDELLATCVQLVFAGHETTQNLISNGLLALLQQREQFDRLARRPVPRADRHRGAVALRRARADVGALDEDGRGDRRATMLRPGEPILVFLGAGNRDPEQFPDPDDVDVARADNKHLGFGAGVHFCLGGPLARLEARIAIAELVRRFPEMQTPRRRPAATSDAGTSWARNVARVAALGWTACTPSTTSSSCQVGQPQGAIQGRPQHVSVRGEERHPGDLGPAHRHGRRPRRGRASLGRPRARRRVAAAPTAEIVEALESMWNDADKRVRKRVRYVLSAYRRTGRVNVL